MRKFLCFITVFLLIGISISYAQIRPLPFSESFDVAGLPEGWQAVTGHTAAVWEIANSSNAGGEPYEARGRWYDYDGTSRLITPQLQIADMFGRVNYLSVSFRHFFDDWGAGMTAKVQYSLDGETWNDTDFVINSGGGDVGPTPTAVIIDLTEATTGWAQIAWVVEGDHYQYNFWFVDDVFISEAMADDFAVTGLAVNYLNYVDAVVPVTASISNSGMDAGSRVVTFKANGVVIDTADTGYLESGEMTTVTVDWTPTVTDSYEITAEVPDDDYNANNMAQADAVVVYHTQLAEGFEGDFLPLGWTETANEQEWMQTSAAASPHLAIHGNHTALIAQQSHHPEEMLITRAFVIGAKGNDILYYWTRGLNNVFDFGSTTLQIRVREISKGEWEDIGEPIDYAVTGDHIRLETVDLSGLPAGVYQVGFATTSTFSYQTFYSGIVLDDVYGPEIYYPADPEFTIDPEEWDYGLTELGMTKERNFTITNTGGGTMEVEVPVLYEVTKDANYSLSYADGAFPASLGSDQSVMFTVSFHPTGLGELNAEVLIEYDDSEFSVELSGEGHIRPAGSTCTSPLDITLPLINYQDNTEPYGNDYTSAMVDPASSYLNGYDFVARFTMEENGWLQGSVSGSWTGVFILQDCPSIENPAERLALGSGAGGGSFSVYLEAGTYFAIVSTWPSPAFTDFTLNLSLAANVVFQVSEAKDLIEGAAIVIKTTGDEPVVVATGNTDENGEAEFLLPYGDYTYTISKVGYADITDVPFNVPEDALINVEMTTIPATFDVNPAEKDFGEVVFGETAQQMFTVSNVGGGILGINSIALIHNEDEQFSIVSIDGETDPALWPDDWSLETGDPIQVLVEYAPSIDGLVEAYLEIIDDLEKEVHHVPLSGTGFDGIFHLPFTQDFTGTFPPYLWSRYAGFLEEDSELETATWGWVHAKFANDTTLPSNNATKINIWGTGRRHWLVTPLIDLGDVKGEITLEFDLALTKWNTSGAPDTNGDDDYFAIVISTDEGVTWSSDNILAIWDNAGSERVFNDISNTGERVYVSLNGYSGVVKLGFYAESTVSNADNDLHVTNIHLYEFEEPQYYSLTMYVLDSLTYLPIADANVQVHYDGKEYWEGYTDEDGLFFLENELPDANYYFTVTAEGYEEYNGEFVIDGYDAYLYVGLDALPPDTYSVTFFAYDYTTEEPVEGAEVYVGMGHKEKTWIGFTDEFGEVVFDLEPGPYFYTVAAEGYEFVYDVFDVFEQDAYIYVELMPITEPEEYIVTFFVFDHDTEEPIEGAQVYVYYSDKEVLVEHTDEYGLADIWLYEGYYSYEVHAEGYYYAYGDFDVTDEDLWVPVPMEPEYVPEQYTVTFTVFDYDTSEPVEGAGIDIYGAQYQYYGYTDEFGVYAVELYDGAYLYNVWAEGYESIEGQQFSVDGEDLEIMVYLYPDVIVMVPAIISLENPAVPGIWKWTYNPNKSVYLDTEPAMLENINADKSQWTWQRLIQDLKAQKLMAADISGNGLLEVIIHFDDNVLGYYSFATGTWAVLMNDVFDFTVARTAQDMPKKVVFSIAQGVYVLNYGVGLDRIYTVPAEILHSADLYRDGLDELLIGFGTLPNLYVYSFASASHSVLARVKPSQMVTGDITGDGYNELVCAFEGFGLYLFRNIAEKGQLSHKVSDNAAIFNIINDVPENHKWVSGNKGWQIQRITYADPMPGHQMATGNIAEGDADELVLSMIGRTYYYSYVTKGWTTLTFAPMKTIIAGRFTGGEKDDLIACMSLNNNIFLRPSAVGAWQLMVTAGNTNAMTPFE